MWNKGKIKHANSRGSYIIRKSNELNLIKSLKNNRVEPSDIIKFLG